MNLQRISNRDLFDEWMDSVETMAQDPGNGYAKRREEQCFEEIIKRMQESSRRPLVRQEA